LGESLGDWYLSIDRNYYGSLKGVLFITEDSIDFKNLEYSRFPGENQFTGKIKAYWKSRVNNLRICFNAIRSIDWDKSFDYGNNKGVIWRINVGVERETLRGDLGNIEDLWKPGPDSHVSRPAHLYFTPFSKVGRQEKVEQLFKALEHRFQELQSPWEGNPEQVYEQVVKLDLRDAQALVNLGWALRRSSQVQDIKKAIDCFERAVSIAPQDASAWGSLGKARQQVKNYDGAIEAFNYAIAVPKREHENAGYWWKIGRVREEQKEYALAIQAYDRAHSLHPSAYSFEDAARVRRINGDLAGAIQAYEQMLEKDPNDSRAWNGIATICLIQGNNAGAIEACMKLLEIVQNNAGAWAQLALAHALQGNITKAHDLWEEGLVKSEYWSWVDLGDTFEALGRLGEAIYCWEQCDLDKIPLESPFTEIKEKTTEIKITGIQPTRPEFIWTPEEQMELEARQRQEQEQAGIIREQGFLDRLKKLVRVSRKLKVAKIALILGITEDELYPHLVDWADQFGFILDEDSVDFTAGQKEKFIADLDLEFATWGIDSKS
jgi:tetratricopeptide (TPR) repeat protein